MFGKRKRKSKYISKKIRYKIRYEVNKMETGECMDGR